MTYLRTFIICLITLALLSSCAGTKKKSIYYGYKDDVVKVKLVTHGWHVGVIIPVNEQFIEQMPESLHAVDYKFAEIGWGDRDFYTGSKRGLWGKFKGALLPTRSVVHVSAFNQAPENFFHGLEITELYISAEGYDALLKEFLSTFEMDNKGQIMPLQDGLYSNALFYSSRRRYFLPRTSNTWAARLLKEAGLPFTPWLSTTSRAVMRQARAIQFVFEDK